MTLAICADCKKRRPNVVFARGRAACRSCRGRELYVARMPRITARMHEKHARGDDHLGRAAQRQSKEQP